METELLIPMLLLGCAENERTVAVDARSLEINKEIARHMTDGAEVLLPWLPSHGSHGQPRSVVEIETTSFAGESKRNRAEEWMRVHRPPRGALSVRCRGPTAAPARTRSPPQGRQLVPRFVRDSLVFKSTPAPLPSMTHARSYSIVRANAELHAL